MTFHLHDSWTSNALAAIDGSVGEVTVPVVALDDYLGDADEIKFVKMDIDGSEPLVIEGMKKTIKRSKDIRILTEYQPHGVLVEVKKFSIPQARHVSVTFTKTRPK